MSYIIKRNPFFRLFKLIEELGGTRNVKFGKQVTNNQSRRESEDLNDILTPRRDR